MAKFLDKKERVIDFQLTPYGKHRLSIGQLRPHSYAFFDTGITYDVEYAGDKEIQTKIHERIKTETQFIEGIMFFEEAEKAAADTGLYVGHEDLYSGEAGSFGSFDLLTISELKDFILTESGLAGPLTDEEVLTKVFNLSITPAVSLFDLEIVPRKYTPKPEKLSFESAIGDAKFEGENTQASPAWKIVTCQGEMSNIRERDTTNYNLTDAEIDQEIMEFNIPQIDVDAYYTLLVSKPGGLLEEEKVSDFISETQTFVDGHTIKLVRDDIVVYAEEANTELLTENFDIQVFDMQNPKELIRLATGRIVTGLLDVGDTITLRDGKEVVTFKMIENTEAAKLDAISEFEESGIVGVVVSDNYKMLATTNNRKGSMFNLISAINGDNGTTALGYPTDPLNGSTADGTAIPPGASLASQKGRCQVTFDDEYGPCRVGAHNLDVTISKDTIEGLFSHALAGGSKPYSIDITNNRSMADTPSVNPNILWTISSAGSTTTGTGFSDGVAKSGFQLIQKYFKNENPQIVDGLMKSARPEEMEQSRLTTDAVDFYFNVLTDKEVDGKIACSCASTFNRNSYYVDIDFDCLDDQFKEIYYDIYGSATAPEICDVPNDQINTIEELRLKDADEGCED